MKTSKLLVTGLLFAAVSGCGPTVVHNHPAIVADPQSIETPAEETTVVEETVEAPPSEAEVVEIVETVEEPVVVQRPGTIVHVEIEREHEHEREWSHRGPRLHGPAVVHFNTGYLDGWAGADFFNRGQPLSDAQVDRMIEVGRRQGDPTGKLATPGYQEGYRAGAKRERNPYQRRMTAEQAEKYRTLRGVPADGTEVRSETYVNVAPPPAPAVTAGPAPVVVHTPHPHRLNTQAARQQRVEASRNNLQASQNNLEAEQKRLEAEQKRLEVARLEKEKARKAELEAAKQKREAAAKQRDLEREQREVALKAKLEAQKKEREAERQKLELARQERETARDAELEAAKEKRQDRVEDLRTAREQRNAERKQKLAARKAEREAKKTQTADVAEKP